jgi:predicted 3-demethylubiquinone-9 3-methyltransferase (glyoxalase superfamily)
MKNSIYPCLWFDGQAKAAADFYCSIFKNSKITSDNPIVVNFELNARADDPVGRGKKIMNLNGGPQFKLNQSISFFVSCKTEDETNAIWNNLFEGGKALMPLDKYPWSDRYGWLQDKFGLTWQIALANKDDTKEQITPSLLFTGNNFGHAEEAINLYSSVFKNSSVTTLSHYPDKEFGPGKVLYAEFKLDNNDFIVMDGPGNHAFSFNEALSFVVDCETQEEIDYYWNKLIVAGGQESQCGWLKDKFGVSWQIVPAIIGKLMSDPKKSPKVMQALLKMKKLEIKLLQQAYDG